MSHHRAPENFYIDANGCLTERVSTFDGPDIAIHYDHIPESDVTTVDGLRCTTPLRTVIDLATTTERAEWEQMVRVCLSRRLFTMTEALARVSEPDMTARAGARLLRQFLREPDFPGQSSG